MAVLFRLRYRATDFDVPLREDFVVGRSPSANLTLEDGLVSRRHGLFRMAGNTLLVEDLKSRNGVMVNGERIESPRSLSHLDRVSIGSQDLIVIRVEASNAEMPLTKRTLTAIEIGDPPTEAFSLQEPSEVTRNAQAFDLLRGIAEKSMFMNRFDEAERILRSPLRGLLTRALRDSTKPEEFDEAVNFALELAKGLSEPKWITWVFDVHCAYRVVPEVATVDALYSLVDALTYREPRPIRYMLKALGDQTAHSAPERFAMKRLQGLARLISA